MLQACADCLVFYKRLVFYAFYLVFLLLKAESAESIRLKAVVRLEACLYFFRVQVVYRFSVLDLSRL